MSRLEKLCLLLGYGVIVWGLMAMPSFSAPYSDRLSCEVQGNLAWTAARAAEAGQDKAELLETFPLTREVVFDKPLGYLRHALNSRDTIHAAYDLVEGFWFWQDKDSRREAMAFFADQIVKECLSDV